MKSVVLVLALLIATGALAQGPAIGPSNAPPPASRGDLWQLLTPEQREQLWRSLTPEQRSDVWRGLQPQERREMRDRLGPGAVHGANGPWGGRSPNADNRAKGWTMTPEERQQMREQIREAHRQRRERLEAERARRSP
jgi:Spy/CpxP family protein refolding chaperone